MWKGRKKKKRNEHQYYPYAEFELTGEGLTPTSTFQTHYFSYNIDPTQLMKFLGQPHLPFWQFQHYTPMS